MSVLDRKRTEIMRWKKDNWQIFTFKIMFSDNNYSLRLVLLGRLKTNCVNKVVVGVDLIYDILLKSNNYI